ncbi:MFS transporter [Alkalihalobacillus deserti]|uniref:MFS transporter n=1 Tax=Alkalihalobacillus deserti TaxID=2879466 RepID=UPI001D14781E|nr:MFS transporter [Alkalihalobacillus deserti]
MSSVTMENGNKYNTAKLWQIALFALNNTATNLYMFAIMFVSYYATGVAGLTVVIVSTVLTVMRVFDGFTDPIVGYVIDKTESKFGKFRPMMIIGNIILASSLLIMYNVTHLLPTSLQLIFFIVIYGIYIIGYTFQTATTKAAQTVLTNSPKQRPLFAIFDGIYNTVLFVGGQVVVSSYLVVKHEGFTMSFFTEFNTYAMILSGIFTLLAVVAIWNKDQKEFYGLAEKSTETKIRDYWPILKGSRPMQMLVLAASTDKLAFSLVRNPVILVMLFGILIGDYALSGTVSLITVVPTVLITFIGVGIARKKGLKNSLVKSTWIALIAFSLLILMFLVIDPTTISLQSIGITTVAFLVLYTLAMGFGGLPSALVIPMIADISDYETSKTGRYIPGMLGTVFSFVDKLVSSLAPTIVGFTLALIGYKDEFPQIGDALTTPLLAMTLLLAFGIPLLGLIVSLIAMKFYALDSKKMEEVQEAIAKIKEEGNKDDTPTAV